MKRHSLLAAVVGLVTAVGLVAGSAAPASAGAPVRTAQRCNPAKYKNHYDVVVKDKKPVVTHISAFAMPPHSSRKVTRKSVVQTVLAAKVRYGVNAEVGASGAGKILASASVKTSLTLMASGKRTKSDSLNITDRVSNPTSKNAQIVFFRGNMSARGTFRYTYCSNYYTPTGNVGYFVYHRSGTWKSFNVYSEGGARCGAGGAVNPVTKAALAQGC